MKTQNKDKRNFIYMILFLVLVIISTICIFAAADKEEEEILNENQETTFDTPDEAYIETQKILETVSLRINKGMNSTPDLEKTDQANTKLLKRHT